MTERLTTLAAATHTPFHADGSLNLAAVETQAEHLHQAGIRVVFIGGTTGEYASLSLAERMALAGRWRDVSRATPLRVIVHVGANCLADARDLAAQAQQLGHSAVAALAPSYFKPSTMDALIACCADVATAAPRLPFYFYDIPSMTGVSLPMPEFLEKAGERIPNLAGLKFTNPDLLAYQQCLAVQGGRFDLPFGIDECLLAALAVGGRGGVGSSYNFAGPISLRLLSAFERGDLPAARLEQGRSVKLISLMIRTGYMAAAKATMGFLGVPVGPPRLPFTPLPSEKQTVLRRELETLGFFEWLKA